MTYIPRNEVTDLIPNKFEAVRVLSLECRRLNDEMRAREQHTEKKITSTAVRRLLDGEVDYYDARERREQERNEAMLAAAEGILDAAPIAAPTASISDVSDDGEAETTEAKVEASAEEAAEASTEEASTETTEEAPAVGATADVAAEGAESPESSEAGEAEAAKE